MEHVPPKCLFPELKDTGVDYRKNLITVPSCDEHNLKKSHDDEHLLYVLAMNLPSGQLGSLHFHTKIMRAIKYAPALAHSVLKETKPITVVDRLTGAASPSIAVKADWPRLERSLEQVARGLYYHHFTKQHWNGPVNVYLEFTRSLDLVAGQAQNARLDEASAAADRMFASVFEHGSNPAVFVYQVVELGERNASMRLRFYGGSLVLIHFGNFV